MKPSVSSSDEASTALQGAAHVVVFAPLPPPVNGQSRATASAVSALARTARVTVVDTAIRSSGRALAWRRPGRLPAGHARAWIAALGHLRRTLRTARPDVLYLTPSASMPGLVRDLATLALVPRDLPVVAHVHAGDYGRLLAHPVAGVLARRAARRFTRILVPSRYAADGLRAQVGPVPVRVVPNRVPDALHVAVDEVAERLARPVPDVPHVAFVSHLIPSKGHERLALAVEAWEAATGRRLRVTYAGAWPSEAARDAFEARLAPGAGRWQVTGPLDADAVRALLLDADVFAFPSLYPHESFGLAPLEAMHAGCGVVALRHAAIEELVRDGVEGRIADPARDGALTEALADVLADPRRFGRAAAARARDAFDAMATDAALVAAVLGTGASASDPGSRRSSAGDSRAPSLSSAPAPRAASR